MKIKFIVCLCMSAFSFTANAAQPTTIKALITEALTSSSGMSSGTIAEGKESETIHKATGAYDPLRCEVTTLKRYKEEGCARLSVKLIQPNAPTKEGGKTDFAMDMGLNICQDGQPPKDISQ